MAKKSDFVNLGDKLDKLLEFMQNDAKGKASAKSDAEESKTKKSSVKALKANAQKLAANTAGIFGLTASMFTLKGVMGDLKGMNSQVSKALTQVNLATQGSAKTIARFNDSATGLQQQIGAFATAVDMGMSNFSDSTLKFSTQLKAQGVNEKATMSLMRANTQTLGMSESASLALADSLVSTAAANGDSIEGLVSAIAGMKEAMISATISLGPKAAATAERVAAMMSQGNSDLQEASAKFVSSFLNGSEGMLKAAQLGVTITGEESDIELAAKFQQLIDKIADTTNPMKGAGSQPGLEGFMAAFNVDATDVNLAQQLQDVPWATALIDGNTDQRQRDLSNASMDQAYQNATRKTQTKGLTAMEGIAKAINTTGKWMDGYMIGILAFMGTLVGIGWSILTAVRLNSMMSLKGGAKGLGKKAVSSGAKLRFAGSKMASSSNVLVKAFGKLTQGVSKVSQKMGAMAKGVGGFFKGIGSKFGKLGKFIGPVAKGFGKVLGPLAAVSTGIFKGIETGSWVEGLKRGVTSAVIYGAGVALAPLTGGASLIGAMALDATLGDAISNAIPGGAGPDAKENKKQTTKDLAKQTSTSMLQLGINKEAGFSEEQLATIEADTLRNLQFNEDIKNMTRDQLEITKASLEENRAGPMTQLSNYLVTNLMAMDKIVAATVEGNEQRADQTTAIVETGQEEMGGF